MNLAVTLYRDVPNPLNIPQEWPSLVQELGESTTLPEDGRPWVLMTLSEYNAYRELHSEAKEAWNLANAIEVTPNVQEEHQE